ncbi:hypothetical protein RRG08_044515 [Elysia crispata]|uniref:Kazal-like domain-containing protein n=1 Tax=Elysia crispata TaxID=231223 RepID=A0AAE0ZBB3_9GAST|nr:hypothetical protein RRG08_044515 [Elysia crispata]
MATVKNAVRRSMEKLNGRTDEEPALVSPDTPEDESEELQPVAGAVDGDLDTRCGFWLFQASFLQPCARIECFTAFYSLTALITSTLNVYVNSQITTLERQFGFSSTQTGLIMAANDVGFLVCVLFVSYSASNFHIPRSLGVAVTIFGLSGLVCCLPFFLFRSYIDAMVATVTDTGSGSLTSGAAGSDGPGQSVGMFGDLCLPNRTVIQAPDSSAAAPIDPPDHVRGLPSHAVTASLAIIFVGMMLQGFGKSPRYSFTVTYVDDNTGKTNTGFYMGIIIACGIFGPTVAYALGGVFSRIFVTLEETTLTPQHPRWIGAWWLGYITCGIIALLAAMPLMLFPRRLPPRQRRHSNKDKQTAVEEGGEKTLTTDLVLPEAKTDAEEEKSDLKSPQAQTNGLLFYTRHFKLFLGSISRLLTNPVYLSVVASSCCDIFSVSGLSAYTPKYMEQMFDLPTYMANYILSANVLCAACMGTFIGGYLSRRLKMTARPALLFTLLVESTAMAGGALGFVFACEQPTVQNWPGSPEACNDACDCEDNSFFAVCGSDGETYYSPCAAGCQQVEDGVYHNCTCIPGISEAYGGMCPYGCGHIYTYFMAITVRGLFGTLSIVPKLVVYISYFMAITVRGLFGTLSIVPKLVVYIR